MLGVSGAGAVPAPVTRVLFGAVELNEVGFKFVRKCINAVETKGEVLPPGTRSRRRRGVAARPCS